MYTIVSDKYGYGSYDSLGEIIEQVRNFGYGDLFKTILLCECGKIVSGLIDIHYEVVAVETEHVHHSAW
jgi:hypothetical protein